MGLCPAETFNRSIPPGDHEAFLNASGKMEEALGDLSSKLGLDLSTTQIREIVLYGAEKNS